jgi:hypothetical protein
VEATKQEKERKEEKTGKKATILMNSSDHKTATLIRIRVISQHQHCPSRKAIK